jgi:hypothetical protein
MKTETANVPSCRRAATDEVQMTRLEGGTMTVQELIDQLQNQDHESRVGFCYDYGDHAHTMVVADIKVIEERCVVYSDYHSMDRLANDGDTDGQGGMEKDHEEVVLLSNSRLEYR